MNCNRERGRRSLSNPASIADRFGAVLARWTILLSSFWTLSGCASSGASYPTPFPPEMLPTIIAQTAQALRVTALALTPSPTVTPTPTATLTPTDTPIPTSLPPAPNARIRFLTPGPLSILSSPIKVRVYLLPGETNRVQISLYGEDGRLLVRKLTVLGQDSPPPGIDVSLELDFEVQVAELGRLEVLMRDMAGRIEALNSIRVTLLPVGMSRIQPADVPYERAVFYRPQVGEVVSGGLLTVEGSFWPLNDQPAFIELQDEAGRPLMTRQLSLVGEGYISFQTALPYRIAQPTSARLSIRQIDPRFGEIAYLYSIVVRLEP